MRLTVKGVRGGVRGEGTTCSAFAAEAGRCDDEDAEREASFWWAVALNASSEMPCSDIGG
jgi:hypothetical protein